MAGIVEISAQIHAQTHIIKAKNERIGDSHSKQLLKILISLFNESISFWTLMLIQKFKK